MDYGKFNSAEELLKGYTELEKSFTQKCQQLAQLRQQQGTSEGPQTVEASPPVQSEPVAGTIPEAPASTNDFVPTEKQLQQFLEQNPIIALKLLQSQAPTPTAPTVMTGGGSMSLALPSKPSTIKEATLMAHKLFDNA